MKAPASMLFVTSVFLGGAMFTMLTATADGSSFQSCAKQQAFRPPADGLPLLEQPTRRGSKAARP
jgi:hypothetical protein